MIYFIGLPRIAIDCSHRECQNSSKLFPDGRGSRRRDAKRARARLGFHRREKSSAIRALPVRRFCAMNGHEPCHLGLRGVFAILVVFVVTMSIV